MNKYVFLYKGNVEVTTYGYGIYEAQVKAYSLLEQANDESLVLLEISENDTNTVNCEARLV